MHNYNISIDKYTQEIEKLKDQALKSQHDLDSAKFET